MKIGGNIRKFRVVRSIRRWKYEPPSSPSHLAFHEGSPDMELPKPLLNPLRRLLCCCEHLGPVLSCVRRILSKHTHKVCFEAFVFTTGLHGGSHHLFNIRIFDGHVTVQAEKPTHRTGAVLTSVHDKLESVR